MAPIETKVVAAEPGALVGWGEPVDDGLPAGAVVGAPVGRTVPLV